MEEELGFKLFDRAMNKVELTIAGNDFYARARELLASWESSSRQSKSVAAGVVGVLRIMFPGSIEGFGHMANLRDFADRYPDVDIEVIVKPPEVLLSHLRNGNADACIGPLVDLKSDADTDFTIVPLREDSVVIVCSNRHPFARQKRVPVSALHDQTIIMCRPSGAGVGEMLTYRRVRINPLKTKQVTNVDEMLLNIELGCGIGFLPRFATERIAPSSADGIRLVECDFGDKPLTVTSSIGYLKRNQNPVLKNFLNVLLQR
jgi:DNA-binding transcriptional LysR family regulator